MPRGGWGCCTRVPGYTFIPCIIHASLITTASTEYAKEPLVVPCSRVFQQAVTFYRSVFHGISSCYLFNSRVFQGIPSCYLLQQCIPGNPWLSPSTAEYSKEHLAVTFYIKAFQGTLSCYLLQQSISGNP